MRLIPIVLALGVVAGCGVDGAPEKPEPRTGVQITGTAEFGVVGSF